MQDAGNAIRSVFNKAATWRFTGVARCDLLANTSNAQRAVDIFGECPATVVLKEQRARFAPVIKLRPEASKPAVAVLDEDEVVDEVPMVPAFA